MNEVCIIVGVFFLLCVLVSWRQGLFKVLISAAGLILGMVIAVYVSPHVSTYLQEHTTIDEYIASKVEQSLPDENKESEITRAMEVAMINELPLPDTIKYNLLDNNNSEVYKIMNASGIYDYISKSAAIIFLNSVVFMLLTSVLHCGIYFVAKTTDIFKKLPIIKSIDKLGGAAIGVVKGLIFIWFFFLILSITSAMSWSQYLTAQIGESGILKLLYNHNILLDIVGNLSRIIFH